jgi:hypothetical protein
MSKRLVLACLLTLLASLAGSAAAQNILTGKYLSDADATLRVPLRPLARPETFLPLEIEIRTQAPIEGTIEVSMNTGEMTPPTIRPISVGRGARHRVTVPVRLGGWPASPQVTIRDHAGRYVRIQTVDMEAGGDDEAKLAAGLPVQTEIPLKTVGFSSEALHVAVLGEDPLGWTLLRTMNGSAIERHRAGYETERNVVVVTMLPTEAPAQWFGWDSVDIVVWRRPDPEQMTPEQVDALVGFVAAGGTLLVSLDASYANFARSVFGRMSGLSFHGLEAIPAIPTLSHAIRPQMELPETQDLLVVSVKGGDVRVAHDGRPLVVQQAVGGGRVVVLTFDVADGALKGVVDRETFWRRLLGIGPTYDAVQAGSDAEVLTQYEADSLFDLEPIARRFVDRDPAEDAGWTSIVHSELEDFEGLSPLPVSFLIGFGLLYLLLIGPVDYFVLRRIGRPGLTWVTFPVVALVFSGVAVITVSLGRTGGSEMSCIEVVEELSGTELARGSVWCSLWSSGRDDVIFAVPDADGWFGPGGSDLEHGWEEGTYEDVHLRTDGHNVAMALQTAPWSLSRFRAAWLGPGVGGEVTIEDGQLHNATEVAFRRAWFVHGSTYWPLGSVDANGTISMPKLGAGTWPLEGRARWNGELFPIILDPPGIAGVPTDLATGPGWLVGWAPEAHPPEVSGEISLRPETRSFRRIPVTRFEPLVPPPMKEETP